MPNRLVWRLNETVMNDLHEAYLNLGSNIEPETNLVKAIRLLHQYGDIGKISNAWESRSVGAEAPNYLNACVLFKSTYSQVELKEQITRPIEARLGRERNKNKYAPRTMDIDIIVFDGESTNEKFWNLAFVILPLAEIHPEYLNPITQERITETAIRLRKEVWTKTRPEVLSQFHGGPLKGQN